MKNYIKESVEVDGDRPVPTNIKKEVQFEEKSMVQYSDTKSENTGPNITLPENVTKKMRIKCSECKQILPNDRAIIKAHMITEHLSKKEKPSGTVTVS